MYVELMLRITEHISIPENELTFTASRSSGPGGQNVNKVSTRVTLWFNVVQSPTLTGDQKKLIMEQLATRIGKNGTLRIVSQKARTQSGNRELALERFAGLIREAIRVYPRRKKTAIPPAGKARRVETKKKHGMLKKQRTIHISEDEG